MFKKPNIAQNVFLLSHSQLYCAAQNNCILPVCLLLRDFPSINLRALSSNQLCVHAFKRTQVHVQQLRKVI